MFEQVREAGLALRLLLRADIVPHRHRDDRRLAIGVNDDAQTVGKRELLIGDIDFGNEVGDGGGGIGGRGGLRGGARCGDGGQRERSAERRVGGRVCQYVWISVEAVSVKQKRL